MTALLIGLSALAVTVLGWFGYKAYRRIERWGGKMNDIDRIFQEASEHDEFPAPASNDKRPRGGVPLALPRKGTDRHAV